MEVHPFNQLARIIVLDENATLKEYCLSTDKYNIGRSPLCQIIIDRGTVSRIHARIERDGPRYILRDLNSRNGTFVNNHRLAKNDPFILSNRDYIGLGVADAVLQFIDPDPTVDVLDGLYYDEHSHVFVLDSQPLGLTPTETLLLTHLYKHAGQLCLHEDLAMATWSQHYDASTDADRLHRIISDIRGKLGGAGATVTIEPTRDRGYKLRLLNSPDILS